ncbi:MAG: hypothetical protein HY903_19630 [Deltaproteobacteria bacterium]|nr:hypothetical protein [Deltaproteobacteria bacterium]
MRRLLALIAIGAVLVAGAAVAGVLAARREVAKARADEAPTFANLSRLVPAYPGARFFPMGEALRTAGVWREMGYALTEDSVRQVADRYEGIWRSQGYAVERRGTGAGEWVMAQDLKDPWARAVFVSQVGGETVIVASVRDLWRAPEPAPVPVPPDCEVVSDDGARDHGVATSQVLLSCRAHLDEIVRYYDTALAGGVRREHLGANAGDRQAYLTYADARRQVTLLATESDATPETPRVSVSITWQEER